MIEATLEEWKQRAKDAEAVFAALWEIIGVADGPDIVDALKSRMRDLRRGRDLYEKQAKDAEAREEGMRNVLMLTELGIEVCSLVDERDAAHDDRRAAEADRDHWRSLALAAEDNGMSTLQELERQLAEAEQRAKDAEARLAFAIDGKHALAMDRDHWRSLALQKHGDVMAEHHELRINMNIVADERDQLKHDIERAQEVGAGLCEDIADLTVERDRYKAALERQAEIPGLLTETLVMSHAALIERLTKQIIDRVMDAREALKGEG